MKLNGVLGETVITLMEARDHCPKIRGKRPNQKTIYLWCRKGLLVHGRTVRTVKLESAFCGRLVVTSVQAVKRFFDALNPQPEQPIESPKQSKTDTDAAIERMRKRFAKV